MTKPRTKRSIKCDEAEPTPAQKRKQERQEILNTVKKRQRRHLESPTDHGDNGFLAKAVLFTEQLPAYPSYDENLRKSRRVGHGPKGKKLARCAPWDKDAKFKKPCLPPGPPVGTTPRHQDPIAAMGILGNLPTETRDEILRYILLWPQDIIVFDGWSRVYPRSRPRLNLSILYTCQVLRQQGIKILFGENQFTYDLRDPVASHGHTNPVLDKVFANSMVPINEYGHLIRYVKIKVHRSRLHFGAHRRNFGRALLKFLPGGGLAHAAAFHTLTLELPAETKGDLEWHLKTSEESEQNEVPICKYLREGSKLFDALFKLPMQWVRVLAWDKLNQCWWTEVDMRYFAKDEQMRLDYIALEADQKHGEAGDAENQSTPRDPTAVGCYRTKDVGAMEELWDERVSKATSKLYKLADHIKALAINPDHAVNKCKLWKPVPANGPETDASDLLSLPPNFRDPSLSSRSRSSRRQTTPGFPNPDITRMKANSEANAKTTARTNLDYLNVLNARNTAKELSLLEAQQDKQANEAAMLTAQWLESLPQHDPEDIQGAADGDEAEANTADVQNHE